MISHCSQAFKRLWTPTGGHRTQKTAQSRGTPMNDLISKLKQPVAVDDQRPTADPLRRLRRDLLRGPRRPQEGRARAEGPRREGRGRPRRRDIRCSPPPSTFSACSRSSPSRSRPARTSAWRWCCCRSSDHRAARARPAQRIPRSAAFSFSGSRAWPSGWSRRSPRSCRTRR